MHTDINDMLHEIDMYAQKIELEMLNSHIEYLKAYVAYPKCPSYDYATGKALLNKLTKKFTGSEKWGDHPDERDDRPAAIMDGYLADELIYRFERERFERHYLGEPING